MSDFVQLWVYLSSAPLFGLTATLIVYVMVQAAYERLHHAPWANPVLWTVLALGTVLLVTGTPYQTYFAGAQFVHVLLGPAVVAGLVGALSGKYLFDLLGIRDWGVRGFALGTASHGIGAARALQVHAEAGAYAGIALGLQVLIASLLLPLAARLFAWLG